MNIENRDYADLQRTDIAVYNFRGFTVLRFNKEKKELEIGKYAEMCSFITDDLRGLSQFLENCYLFAIGVNSDVSHVEVD